MSDLVSHLVARAVGQGARVEPRILPRFASGPEIGSEIWQDSQTVEAGRVSEQGQAAPHVDAPHAHPAAPHAQAATPRIDSTAARPAEPTRAFAASAYDPSPAAFSANLSQSPDPNRAPETEPAELTSASQKSERAELTTLVERSPAPLIESTASRGGTPSESQKSAEVTATVSPPAARVTAAALPPPHSGIASAEPGGLPQQAANLGPGEHEIGAATSIPTRPRSPHAEQLAVPVQPVTGRASQLTVERPEDTRAQPSEAVASAPPLSATLPTARSHAAASLEKPRASTPNPAATPSRPVIRVSIGRIDVRASERAPAVVAPYAPAAREPHLLQLSDYLSRRGSR